MNKIKDKIKEEKEKQVLTDKEWNAIINRMKERADEVRLSK